MLSNLTYQTYSSIINCEMEGQLFGTIVSQCDTNNIGRVDYPRRLNRPPIFGKYISE